MRINSTLYYILKDHLGSASVVTDASGVVVGENRYFPFGETRVATGTILTDKLFTGQREMAGLGIYHSNARFYSPKLGRFLSADTIVPGYANPQAFNRYSYVVNNPLKYTDPTGHSCIEEDGDGNIIHVDCDSGAPPPPGNPPNPPDDDDRRDDDPTPTPIPSPTPPVTVPTPTMSSTGTPPPFTQSSPNYGQITAGVALLVTLIVLVDIPIIVGLVALAPEIEIAMVVELGWVIPLGAAIVAVHVFAIDLIIEGATGQNEE